MQSMKKSFHDFKKQFTRKKTENFALKVFDGRNLDKAINLLIYGVSAKKFTKNQKKSEKLQIYLKESDLGVLQCLSFKKNAIRKFKIKLSQIHNITDVFDIKNTSNMNKKFAFSMVYGPLNSVIMLEFETSDKKMLFWEALQHLYMLPKTIKKLKSKTFSVEWMHMKKEDKEYSRKEVEMFLCSNGIEYNKKFLKACFKNLLAGQPQRKNEFDPKINFIGLKQILLEFALKYEVQDVFQKYTNGTTESIFQWEQKFMSKLEFEVFLDDIQAERMDTSQREKANRSMFLSQDDNYSYFEFCLYMFSPKNSIFNPEMLTLYQDMTQPLHDYFINSSHNTYLLGNQLTGESSTQAYVNAFNKGCRCVEIDCWDGPKNNPIVTHGNTFTSKISFESVIRCINDYAFQKNPFPVALSIENHCSIQQQEQMVDIMNSIFQEKIYKPDLNEKFKYKSPNDLKYKILIKCKGLSTNGKIEEMTKPDEYEFKIRMDPVQNQTLNEEDIQMDMSRMDEDRSIIPNSIPYFQPKFEYWIANRFIKSEKEKTSFPTLANSTPHETSSKHITSLAFEILKNPNKDFIRSEDNVNVTVTEKISLDKIKENCSEGSVQIPDFKLLVNDKNAAEVEEIDDRFRKGALSPNDSKKKQERLSGIKSRTSHLISFLVSPKNKPNKQTEGSGSFYSSESSKSTFNNAKENEKAAHKISLKLHENLALFGYKLKGFDKKVKAFEIASFTEKKLMKFLNKNYVKLIENNKKSFTRVYPKGIRVDSSNYDPIPGFVCGVQFVALNFQTPDLNLGTYLSVFKQNGGVKSGYVLKPRLLRDKILDERISTIFNQPKLPKLRKSLMDVFGSYKPKTDVEPRTSSNFPSIPAILELNLRLLSGFQILNDNGKLLTEPFFVEIYVKGFPLDESNNKKFTSPLQEDSFHPLFNDADLRLSLVFPELAHLIFVVSKKSSKNIAFYSIPVECIREGYRRVPLTDFSFEEIPGSYLFCLVRKRSLKEHSLK